MTQFIALVVELDYEKFVYLVNLTDKEEFHIGREIDNEVSIPDMSVSRKHCKVHYDREERKIKIFDNDSKFGTSLKKPSVIVNREMNLQKGRTVIQFFKKQRESLMRKMLLCGPITSGSRILW